MKWMFWGAAAFIVYAYAGYMGWLWLRALLRPWPVRRGRHQPTVSILMVVRDEEAVLKAKMQNLLELDYPRNRYEIVVVSDGSIDDTEIILREYADESRVKAVLNQLPAGKASSLNDGIGMAEGEIVVFTDARQMLENNAIRKLIENFADPDVGCVSGQLMLGDPMAGETGDGMGLYWRIEKQLRELEAASGSVVGATGALYAVRRELLTTIPQATILDDVYLPMQAVRQGKRVIFDSRARAWDNPNLGAEREFSRKVRTLSGNYQLVQLLPWLLRAANPIRFEFISHKLLRLAVPFALVILLLSSLLIHGIFYRTVLALQIIFYALSGVALTRLLKTGPMARAADAAGTFVLLNTAALVAFTSFVTGRKVAWTR